MIERVFFFFPFSPSVFSPFLSSSDVFPEEDEERERETLGETSVEYKYPLPPFLLPFNVTQRTKEIQMGNGEMKSGSRMKCPLFFFFGEDMCTCVYVYVVTENRIPNNYPNNQLKIYL
jgi:hypothetical protein